MSRVFISYRRESGWALAGRLYDWLAEKIGKDHVFIDIDDIAPGTDFAEVLENTLSRVDAVVPIIDRDWLDVRDEAGNRRIESAGDFVRRELAMALRRDILVVPFLEPGAAMPTSDDLPDDLADLPRRNAVFASQKHFKLDVDRLIDMLAEIRSELDLSEFGRHAKAAGKILEDEEEMARWENNYKISDSIWAPAQTSAHGWRTLRAPAIERFSRMDFGDDAALNADRSALIELLRDAPVSDLRPDENEDLVYDLEQTAEMTVLIEELDDAIRVRGKFAAEQASDKRMRRYRQMDLSTEVLERWRRNERIHGAFHYGEVLKQVPFGRIFTMRDKLKKQLNSLDLSDDSDLEHMRVDLIRKIDDAPMEDSELHGARLDLRLTPEMSMMREFIRQTVNERGQIARDQL